MIDRRRLFWSEAILLLAVVTPLALAERTWWYWAASVLAVIVGWRTVLGHDRPIVGPLASRLFVIIAFVYLIFEYGWLGSIPVLAIVHFMILVCICKLLQQRTLRDDAQFFVLSLLLLVVAAIISGNVLFPVVLVVFLTLGLDLFIRLHLTEERAAVDRGNQIIYPLPSRTEAGASLGGRWPLIGITAMIALAGLVVGTLIFIFSPRIGESIFNSTDLHKGGRAVTGFSPTIDFGKLGPIAESDQPVMRVQIESVGDTRPEIPELLYFRGTVLNQYHYTQLLFRRGWEWRRFGSPESTTRKLLFKQANLPDGILSLFRPTDLHDDFPLIVQHYWLEPSKTRCVFTYYPAIEVVSGDFQRVRKWVEDQVIELDLPPDKSIRYTVTSAATISPSMAKCLDQERQEQGASAPTPLVPVPPLPREAEIRALINREIGDVGSLEIPANRRVFAERIERYLKSGRYTYTLDNSPVRPGTEPIGEFLLDKRSGHCEYFASAMAIMCQLSGISARVVNGYRVNSGDQVGNLYLVQQKHAHSWVEVFIPPMDWVIFDPTPASTPDQLDYGRFLPQLLRYIDYLQFHWANMVVSYDADRRSKLFDKFQEWLKRPARNQQTAVGALAAFVRELFGWRLQLTVRERLIYWIFSVLIILLVVLIAYVILVVMCKSLGVILRFRQLRYATAARNPESDFYRHYCRCLAALGLHRRRDQTPAEFADELAERFGLFSYAPELVRAYYAIIFGGRHLSPSHRSRIGVFLEHLRHVNRAQLRASALLL